MRDGEETFYQDIAGYSKWANVTQPALDRRSRSNPAQPVGIKGPQHRAKPGIVEKESARRARGADAYVCFTKIIDLEITKGEMLAAPERDRATRFRYEFLPNVFTASPSITVH